ncbi:MAG: heavy metal translocating P-type ATPase [Candidatus Latescibacteria bacterium]|nr:heavy metal translocating P-type ATPase [Candidatus Latescibacterota bacterium]
MQHRVFKIQGLDCVEEVAILKREVGPMVGGEAHLAFDILNAKMIVTPEADEVDTDAIIRMVGETGMQAAVWQDDPDEEVGGFWVRRGRFVLMVVSGACALAGFLSNAIYAGSVMAALGSEGLGQTHQTPWLSMALYTSGIMAALRYVAPKAWFAMRRLRPDMNALMTIAVIGAILIGEWFEAATVSFLFAVSLTLESWSVGRARRAIGALMDLTPPVAHLKQPDGSEQTVTPASVAVGAVVIVKPGERVPVDGRVVGGESAVNQAPITGESQPVHKKTDDPVFAGAINGDGALEIECNKTAGDTTLAHIIRMVGEAQSKRAPSEQWVERFARVYTPIILGLAVLVFLLPPLLFDLSWTDWGYRALVLLVIGCPCALVISTPVSIIAALAASARNGVLVKGGVYMEAPAHLSAIAFDKTGTLTQGKPAIVAIDPLDGHTEEELLARASAMEARSDHPLARAITACAKARGVPIIPAEDFQVIQGKGATARFNGELFWLGSHRYLEERRQETEAVHQLLEARSKAGYSVVLIGNDTHVCGILSIADAIRPETRAALQALKDSGIQHLVMLTGDNEGTAHAIAEEAGVNEVHADLLPEDKVAVVESLVSGYQHVAMIGDGVNDAPAMGRATLGIAMGAVGSDAAIETADIALMSDDLAKLPWLINHARRTLSVIRQNIIFALLVKAIFVIFTFGGLASLWAAIAADMGTSLLVTTNGLRLLRAKNEREGFHEN